MVTLASHASVPARDQPRTEERVGHHAARREPDVGATVVRCGLRLWCNGRDARVRWSGRGAGSMRVLAIVVSWASTMVAVGLRATATATPVLGLLAPCGCGGGQPRAETHPEEPRRAGP